MKVQVLKAIPASGKTKAILENIQETGQKAIIASISRQLSRQSYDYFETLGGSGVIIDADNRKGKTSVNEAIKECIQTSDVLFITHKALLTFSDFDLLKGFHLYIDEVPELVTFEKFSFSQNLDHILEMCEPISGELGVYDSLALLEDHRERVTELAKEGYNGRDDICATLLPLYSSLLQGIPVKLQLTEKGSNCYFITDVSVRSWDVFESITIACANIEDTFTGKILKHFNGWEFCESPLQNKLLFNEYSNSSRITIHVLMEQSWSRHASDQERDGISNYNKMKNIIEGLIHGQDFIYTRNSYRARFSSGLEVPYNPHGLNSYSSYKNAAVMFSFNPMPWQVPLLRELACSAELEPDTLVDAYIVSKYLEPAFQLCSRSNIRISKSNAKVNFFVPDMRLAEYMKELYFPNAIISTENMIKAPERKTERNRKSFQKMFNMTKHEKYRYMYLLRKMGRKLDPLNVSDVMIVQKWITDQRS